MKNYLARILAFSMIFSSAHAELLAPFQQKSSSGQEFFIKGTLAHSLVTVNLINGVRFPGVYHIPENTTLIQLLSYAGGATDDADLTSVYLRSSLGEKSVFKKIDLESLTRSNREFPVMQDNDMLMIEDKPSIDGVIKWVSLASVITGIVSAVIVIRNSQ